MIAFGVYEGVTNPCNPLNRSSKNNNPGNPLNRGSRNIIRGKE